MLSTRSNSNKPSLVAQRAQTTAQATGYQLTHSHTFLPSKMSAASNANGNTGSSTGSMLTNIAQQAKKQRMMYATSSVGSNVAKSSESPSRQAQP